ncbi:MAG: TspO/MBR family protein [Pseudomonadota bacterium]
MENWYLLLVFVGVNILAALTGAFFPPGEWYRTLKKPPWIPPNWLFAPAWTVLYAMIAYAGFAFTVSAEAGERLLPLMAYGLQLVFNAAWSFLFFGIKRMDWALVDALLMFAAIAVTIVLFAPVSSLAAWLMVPYLCWVGFAAVLNYSMMRRNAATRSTA